MKITMVGHACVHVETDGCRILFDPLLHDPHQDDIFAVCPSRKVHLDRIPPVDVIVISHQHLDHFDIPSLALLPRTAEVLFPKDSLIDEILAELGFKKRIALEDWTTTASLCPVPEWGVVIKSADGVYWNQVDTIVDQRIIDTVRGAFGDIDLLQAPWQPMLESAYLWNQSTQFPYAEYERIVRRIAMAQPSAVIPGANGFRYAGSSTWMNKTVFPVTRARFLHDLSRAMPTTVGLGMNPGDTVDLQNHMASLRNQSADWVITTKDDRDDLVFAPNEIDQAARFSSWPCSTDATEIRRELRAALQRYLDEYQTAQKSLLRWEVIYECNVRLAEQEVSMTIDFSESNPAITEHRSSRPTYRTTISANGFMDLVRRKTNWSSLVSSGQYRTCSTVAMIKDGLFVYPTVEDIGDPLWHTFPHAQLLREHLLRQIQSMRDISETSECNLKPRDSTS